MRRALIVIGQVFLLILVTRGVASAEETLEDENFREDVIKCEAAVAHVASCCPGFTAPAKACVFYHRRDEGGCGCESGSKYSESWIWPVLDVNASDGILAASCSALAADDGCARLSTQLSATNSRSEEGGRCASDYY